MIYSCTPSRPHELMGSQPRRPYYPELPVGMVYIPAGGFTLGLQDQDIFMTQDAKHKVVSIASFYMDQTEITNNEYRQFVDWVKDSIALEKLLDRCLAEDVEEFINFEQDVLFKDQVNGAGDGEAGEESAFTDFYSSNEAADYSEIDDESEIPTFETDASALIDLMQVDGEITISKEMRKKVREMLSLNWYTNIDYTNKDYMPLLADMYLPQKERYYKRREIDTRKLIYEYYWIDYREAAKKGNLGESPNGYNFSATPQASEDRINGMDGALLYSRNQSEVNPTDNSIDRGTPIDGVTSDGTFRELSKDETWSDNDVKVGDDEEKDKDGFVSGKDKDMGFMNRKMEWNAYRGHSDRSRFVIHEKIPVYPDTLCWVHDFTYSRNDDLSNMYFWNNAYDNYPVVGITWKQAKAFSVWRTQLMNSYLVANGDVFVNDFRLPSEAEWERAARGDLALQSYPWGGPYIRNASGCFLGNFKPMRGRYFEDGGLHTVKVFSYNPNNFGLFCMAGNVSEWCESAYDESSYEFMHDINPEYRYDAKKWDPPIMKRKVIRGGSWKDIGHYLQVGARTYEYQDTAKCYIGFRNVMTHLGRGGKDFTKEGGEEIQSDIQLR